jgi:hypothetical protein
MKDRNRHERFAYPIEECGQGLVTNESGTGLKVSLGTGLR